MIMGETLTWLHHVWEYVVPQLRGIEADSLERDVKRTSRNSASMCLNDMGTIPTRDPHDRSLEAEMCLATNDHSWMD